MAGAVDFDLDDVLRILNSVIENYPEDSRERTAVELSQIALLYIRKSGKVTELAQYRKECVDTSFTVEVAREFATREEANEWLFSGAAQHAQHVKIAGKGFLTVQLPGRMTFIDRPLPEELNAEEWREESE